MKHLVALTALTFCCPVLAQGPDGQSPELAPNPTPAPLAASKFDWKLRLTKGQTWTQNVVFTTDSTTTAPTTGRKFVSKLTQSAAYKQEVLAVSPASYTVRYTFTRFDLKGSRTTNGKTSPLVVSQRVLDALKGASFTVKQNPGGDVLEVIGIEALVERIRKAVTADAKTPDERAIVEQSVPSVKSLRDFVLTSGENFQSKVPLAAGQSYSYNKIIPFPELYPDPASIKVTRTLRSFGPQEARFENSGKLILSANRPIRRPGLTTYVAFTGALSGPLTVDSNSGIVLRATLTTKANGKATIITSDGSRETFLMTINSQATITTDPTPTPIRP